MSDEWANSDSGGDSDHRADSSHVTPPADPDLNISADTLFDLLANQRRRDILRYFPEMDTTVATVSELAEYVMKKDQSESVSRETVTIDLHHVQLPILADGGLIEYETRSKTVRYDGHPTVERCLTVVHDVGQR